MHCQFIAYGHPNILGMHKTTLEFTKDSEVSLRGNCIVGVNAELDLVKIKKFIKSAKNKKIAMTIEAISNQKSNKKIKDTIYAEINPNFSSDREFVVRKTDFLSERTFASGADKSAFELDRRLIGFLKEKKNKVMVTLRQED